MSQTMLEIQGTLMSPNKQKNYLENLGYITYGIKDEGYNTWTSGQDQIILILLFLLKKN
jgi:hypothetical protein